MCEIITVFQLLLKKNKQCVTDMEGKNYHVWNMKVLFRDGHHLKCKINQYENEGTPPEARALETPEYIPNNSKCLTDAQSQPEFHLLLQESAGYKNLRDTAAAS